MASFIVAAKRTPFGKFGGFFKNESATVLGAAAARATLDAAGLAPELVDSVCVGNVQQTTADGPYIARHVGLKAGVPNEVPMLTVNRLCGSGFQSIVTAAQEIALGESRVVLTGGAESMSSAPYAARGIRFGGPGVGVDIPMKDTLWEGLTDQHIKCPMAITAENLAEQYDISKEDCDEFAVLSQSRYGAAHAAGRFDAELAPFTLKTRKGEATLEVDEHPRADVALEAVAKLPALFKKGGTVTAANASGICDGAGAVLVAGEDAVGEHGLTPLARIVSYAVSGVDPNIMPVKISQSIFTHWS